MNLPIRTQPSPLSANSFIMNAPASAGAPVGHLSDYAATRPHCLTEISSETNEFVKMHVINLAGGKNINDLRKSPAITVLEELANLGAEARVYGPFVPSIVTKVGSFASVWSVEEALTGAERGVFLMDHDMCSVGSLRRRWRDSWPRRRSPTGGVCLRVERGLRVLGWEKNPFPDR